MKKVLLATTMLVAGASVAAAEVTLSGTARMGVVSNASDGFAGNGDESDLAFTSRARVQFNLSEESDSGLTFGATLRADNAADANLGRAGSVFISGAFGRLTMGDVDGAAQSATGNVAGVGLTGLGDLSDSTFLGAGGGTTDPTALYQYSAGSLTVFLSATNPRPVLGTAEVAATASAPLVPATRTTDTQAVAIGAQYTFGDYIVGIGYEKLEGFVAPVAGVTPVLTANNTSIDHIVVKATGTVGGVTIQGLIGQAEGRRAGALVPQGKQYAASASYAMNGITGTVFYTDDSAAIFGGTTAYGVGASYDLGGGASLVGGVAKRVSGPDSTVYDLGVSFTF